MKSLAISPEGLEVANIYLQNGSISDTAKALSVSMEKVTTTLQRPEVKRYIDAVYLDSGYRNRVKLANLMDEIIESKLEEARESEMYSSKDLVDILTIAHKMKMEELKHQELEIKNQTNIQINATENNVFGNGNYGALMKKLLGDSNVIEAEKE